MKYNRLDIAANYWQFTKS